jgi:hypothetical protein
MVFYCLDKHHWQFTFICLDIYRRTECGNRFAQIWRRRIENGESTKAKNPEDNYHLDKGLVQVLKGREDEKVNYTYISFDIHH